MPSGLAKYDGVCWQCNQPITRFRDNISWGGGSKGRHIDCSQAFTVRSATAMKDAATTQTAAEAYKDGGVVLFYDENAERYEIPEDVPEETTETADSTELGSVLGKIILPYIENKLKTKLDTSDLQAAVDTAFNSKGAEVLARVDERIAELSAPTRIVIDRTEKDGTVNTEDLGLCHKSLPDLITLIRLDIPAWLAGPAGSGKTTAAHQAAKALGLDFYFNGAIDSEYKLSGFVDANGRIVSTAFRKAYTDGGLFLFDEVDASSPSAVLAFNAALSNGHGDFPGCETPIQRHADFRVVAAANTWGLGADFHYVGRAKMDAAFLNRFVPLAWDYDEELETALAPDKAWAATVRAFRKKVFAGGLEVIVSPRTTFFGGRMIADGRDREAVRQQLLLSTLTPDQRIALGEK